jgi:3-methyladenine DNA glycosylase Tag
MLNNSSIIRNRIKIKACVKNAKIINKIKEEHNTFCNWFYNETKENELEKLQKIMIDRFEFMGPEIARMWLMASGRI